MAHQDKKQPINVVKAVRQVKGTVILDLQGEVDLHRSVSLRGSLLETLQDKPVQIVVNMQDVEYMDSSGLATLVEALQVSRKNGTQLKLAGLQPRVRSIFEISRLDGIFKIFRDETEALVS